MELTYHQKVFDLLGVSPEPSSEGASQIAAFESLHGVFPPAAVKEWYSIQNSLQLLEQIAIPHQAVPLDTVPEFGAGPHLHFDWRAYFPVLFENQGVWLMCVRMDGSDDPPVHIAENEAWGKWVLHAHSFSDWILALGWDNIVLEQGLGSWGSADDDEKADAWLRTAEVIGPETFCASAIFTGPRFVRAVSGGELESRIVHRSSAPIWP